MDTDKEEDYDGDISETSSIATSGTTLDDDVFYCNSVYNYYSVRNEPITLCTLKSLSSNPRGCCGATISGAIHFSKKVTSFGRSSSQNV